MSRVARPALMAALASGVGACRAGAPLDPELRAWLARAPPEERVAVVLELEPAPASPGAGGPVAEARSRAEAALAPVREALLRRGLWGPAGAGPVLLWAAGALALSVPAGAIDELAALPGVRAIRLDAVVHAPRAVVLAAAPAAGPGWNLAALRATDLWAAGVEGAGTTVAVLDTGVDATHPDLAARFRGGPSDWFDPHGQHAAPADPDGHGTAVAGLAVGGAASGTPIGVAPGARWIAAKVYDDAGAARLSDVHQALQWAADPDGDPATADRPDAVALAFTYPSLVNRCWREFEPDLAVLRAAGAAVVIASGNSGAGATEPPANNPGGFAVGASDAAGVMTSFTSHGASACLAGSYPVVLAPGQAVLTAVPVAFGPASGPYTTVSGTSFAAPQAAGAVALLRAALPDATVDELESALAGAAAVVAGGPGVIDVVAARDLVVAARQVPRAVDDTWELAGGVLSVSAPGVLANDLGPGLSARLVVPPAFGSLVLHPDGSLEYRPSPRFGGEDRFVYLAENAAGASPATAVLRVPAGP